ncbi:MAG: FAD-dependent monooxygenase [Acidimicrobiia bacterium]|nr:FAD-dependent monooxygenase [Acidimicrobiia bacterium]
MSDRRIAVIGAGLTGTVLAMGLADRGHAVHLVERRPDPRRAHVDGDRSINLALSHRGLSALAKVGLDRQVVDMGTPMRGRIMHDRAGDLTYQPYGTVPEHHLVSVSRNGLNSLLLDGCELRPGIEMSFGHRVLDLDLDTGTIEMQVDGGADVHRRYDVVFGADGAFSAVRQRLQRTANFDFEQDFLEHGYKELTIPSAADGSYQMEPEALHIWPRRSHMLIALPNPDGSFTGTLFWPLEGDRLRDLDAGRARDLFADDFADALELIPDLEEEFRDHPVGNLVTTRCAPWNLDDRILLVGDAAHAVVPFYGQGANAGLEDVELVLDRLDTTDDWERAFADFAVSRKPHADALAQLALDNYVEMRDHVASRWFLWRQRIERWLHRLLPHQFVPLYTMVTFTSTPYADAAERARRQQRIAGVVAVTLVLVAVLVLIVVLALVR